MEHIDFGQVAKSYAKAREDIPVSLMDSLYIRGISFDGKKVADIRLWNRCINKENVNEESQTLLA